MKSPTPNDLFQSVPVRNLEWESAENNLVILLVPKFRNRLLARYLLRRMAKPNLRLHLDAYGSFVWRCCDGIRTVGEIADELRKKYGPEAEPCAERTGRFMQLLKKDKFIIIT